MTGLKDQKVTFSRQGDIVRHIRTAGAALAVLVAVTLVDASPAAADDAVTSILEPATSFQFDVLANKTAQLGEVLLGGVGSVTGLG
ncbi:hypothetical protein [Streptomyces luteireticuli]|uniref:hypothetical protein n=1 Tax=Streptomyces luteireticuli TaxID=173858 RepID=UPI00355642DE